MTRPRYIIAFYEIDRLYGGPEEGGWWYDAGEWVRTLRVERSPERAYAVAGRANRLLRRLQRDLRPVHSVAYDGGRVEAFVFRDFAPPRFPERRPHYE